MVRERGECKLTSRIVLGIMPTLLLISMLTLAFNIQQADSSQSPPTEWNITYGGADYDEAMSVVQTGDGYALAGYTRSFGAGASDSWLVKTDLDGNMMWNQTYGGADVDIALSVVGTGDGYALAGYTMSFGAGLADFWLVKTDSAGNMMWNQTYGGADYDFAYSVVQTGDGGYALAGYTMSFGAGGYDIWLVKTDSTGNVQWSQTYGGADYDIALSVVETGDGYVLAGSTDSFGAGEWDFWLVKTDSAGNMMWNQTYGGADVDIALSVVGAGDGYALAGYTWSFGAGASDSWLVKTDLDGNMMWNQTYGGASDDEAMSVVGTGDGYALAGYTWSFGAGASDSWLVKTDLDGNMMWNQTYGGAGADIALSVVETGDGYVLAGSTGSFGAGLADFWLVKVASDTIPGDFDGDGDVDRYDFGTLAGAYGSKVGDSNWNAVCDLDGDGDVDRYDFGTFAGNYGQSV
jgi:hypothetical protein